ncbi:MAG: gamma-glutamyltransferase, partial [Bacteroidota bacterium]|nr:gamma-glutamyltransferase [Bacteroidota bacterium]
MNSYAQQFTVKAKNGVVVSIDKYASQIGVDILKQGGNAVDAAVATGFALAVTHPFAGNIGGGGFMLIKLHTGEEIGIDYREMAPERATPGMFLKPDGTVDPDKSTFGYLVAGVPGTVKGLETAWKKYGKLPWKNLLNPAIQLAEEGIYLNKYDSRELAKNKQHLARYPESKKIFFKKDTETYSSQDLFRQPDLAKTLGAISKRGSKAFYEGRIANKIAADFKRNGGILTKEDLKKYDAKIRQPLKGSFHDYEIIGMPPPSSGGVSIQEMLNILENMPLNTQNPLEPQNLHTLIQTMRYVFLDRTKFLGDPDFVSVPVDKLTAKKYGKALASKIDLDSATSSESLTQNIATFHENMETTHFSVADKFGNVVSNTYTIEEAFGSKAVVKGLGFLLNNEMHDFNINPN